MSKPTPQTDEESKKRVADAAPDLLAACKEAYIFLATSPLKEHVKYAKILMAAIAKAEGWHE